MGAEDMVLSTYQDAPFGPIQDTTHGDTLLCRPAHVATILRLGAGWGYTGPNVSTASGRLIAIEGIDDSGKGTQLELLQRALRARGIAVHATNFPHYPSWFGTMVGQFLDGEF